MSDTAPSPAALQIANRYTEIPHEWRLKLAEEIEALAVSRIAEKDAEIVRLAEHSDANVERVKACEHIACGDDGWEVLRNECPSTAAVATLRDAYVARGEEIVALHDLLDWRPIETAPRKYGHYIELRGPSGYVTTPYRMHVGCWGGDFRPDRWITHNHTDFTDDGEPPTHWRPHVVGKIRT